MGNVHLVTLEYDYFIVYCDDSAVLSTMQFITAAFYFLYNMTQYTGKIIKKLQQKNGEITESILEEACVTTITL